MESGSAMREFSLWLDHERGLAFDDFEALHRWSVEQPSAFWTSIWAFDGVEAPEPPTIALAEDRMPGAVWFPGTRVNYARQVLRHVAAAHAAGQPAIIAEDERGAVGTVDWPTLKCQVASLALALRSLGVGTGDRVCAYLPNRPEAIVAFLATASIGAVWTVCAPDMGVPAILDRFQQIQPRVLIATDAVYYAGRALDRRDTVAHLRASLPTLEHVVLVASGLVDQTLVNTLSFAELIASDDAALANFEPDWVPFDHPLWILYSSGTTGRPKALVHGHGGILLTAAAGRLHMDLGASYEPRTFGERFHWFSSTGWMMWNAQIGGLLSGTTICIFDGSPTGPRDAPDWGQLWRFAARNKVTFFGSGAQFYTLCAKSGLDFNAVGDLSGLRALGSTASPLSADVQIAMSQAVATAGRPDIWWFNSSGGTDICGAFCTGNRDLPEAPGKLQCRQLGAAVEAWNEAGRLVTDEVGELVCTRPMPSMPLYLFGDPDGARYRESYFDKFPGVWRHGDWIRIEADGTCEIFGRSDATINRGGHRMGTSEIYSAVERLDEVADSLVIDVRVREGDSQLILFLTPAEGFAMSSDLETTVRQAIRNALSPRFVPDRIIAVAAIPRTLSSKKQELPIKRLFEGAPIEKVIDVSAMANPDCLDVYQAMAAAFVHEHGAMI
ncbi:MAG: acetoacetate--CoA ligase [bacterium]|nr:acetoacetate--CoA ligase [bacterium]